MDLIIVLTLLVLILTAISFITLSVIKKVHEEAIRINHRLRELECKGIVRKTQRK